MTANGLECVIVLAAVVLVSGAGVTRTAAEDTGENGVKPEKLISLSLVGADLRAVIAALAEKHGVNIYGGEKIRGTVTAHLKDVPLEDLLKVLLKSNGYVMVKHSDVFYEVVAQSEEARKKEQELASGMMIRSFDVKYADLEAVSELLTTMGALGSASKVAISERSSQIIIRTTPGEIEKIEGLIKRIDVEPPQMLIRARIIEVEENAYKSLGLEWTTADWVAAELDSRSATGMTASLGQTVEGVADTFTFSRTHPDNTVNYTLDALAQKGLIEVLAAPRLTAINNKEAVIKMVDRVPIIIRQKTTTDSGTIETTESVTFQDAGLVLTIRPRKVGDNQVLLTINPEVTQLSGWTDTDPAQPIIDTRSAKTEVILRSGQWLVIGGLVTTNAEVLRKKVPILGDIPLLGIAFSSSKHTKKKADLLILVSAEILNDEAIAADTVRAREEQVRLRRHGKKEDRFWKR